MLAPSRGSMNQLRVSNNRRRFLRYNYGRSKRASAGESPITKPPLLTAP